MAKALTLFLGLCMVVQIIRPLGLPGLHRRADAWKLVVGAVVITLAVAVLSTG